MTMCLVRHLARMRSISHAMTTYSEPQQKEPGPGPNSALNVSIKTLVLRF